MNYVRVTFMVGMTVMVSCFTEFHNAVPIASESCSAWCYQTMVTGRSDQDLAISSALILWLKAPSNVFCLSAGLGSSGPAQCQLPAVQALFGLECWQGYLAP